MGGAHLAPQGEILISLAIWNADPQSLHCPSLSSATPACHPASSVTFRKGKQPCLLPYCLLDSVYPLEDPVPHLLSLPRCGTYFHTQPLNRCPLEALCLSWMKQGGKEWDDVCICSANQKAYGFLLTCKKIDCPRGTKIRRILRPPWSGLLLAWTPAALDS